MNYIVNVKQEDTIVNESIYFDGKLYCHSPIYKNRNHIQITGINAIKEEINSCLNSILLEIYRLLYSFFDYIQKNYVNATILSFLISFIAVIFCLIMSRLFSQAPLHKETSAINQPVAACCAQGTNDWCGVGNGQIALGQKFKTAHSGFARIGDSVAQAPPQKEVVKPTAMVIGRRIPVIRQRAAKKHTFTGALQRATNLAARLASRVSAAFRGDLHLPGIGPDETRLLITTGAVDPIQLNPKHAKIVPPNYFKLFIESRAASGRPIATSSASLTEINYNGLTKTDYKEFKRFLFERLKKNQEFRKLDFQTQYKQVTYIAMWQVMGLERVPKIETVVDEITGSLNMVARKQIDENEHLRNLENLKPILSSITETEMPVLSIFSRRERTVAPYVYAHKQFTLETGAVIYGPCYEVQTAHLLAKFAGGLGIELNLGTMIDVRHAVLTGLEKMVSPQTTSKDGGVQQMENCYNRYNVTLDSHRQVVEDTDVFIVLDNTFKPLYARAQQNKWNSPNSITSSFDLISDALNVPQDSPQVMITTFDFLTKQAKQCGAHLGAIVSTAALTPAQLQNPQLRAMAVRVGAHYGAYIFNQTVLTNFCAICAEQNPQGAEKFFEKLKKRGVDTQKLTNHVNYVLKHGKTTKLPPFAMIPSQIVNPYSTPNESGFFGIGSIFSQSKEINAANKESIGNFDQYVVILELPEAEMSKFESEKGEIDKIVHLLFLKKVSFMEKIPFIGKILSKVLAKVISRLARFFVFILGKLVYYSFF